MECGFALFKKIDSILAHCTLCLKILSHSGNTAKLNRYLKNFHKASYDAYRHQLQQKHWLLFSSREKEEEGIDVNNPAPINTQDNVAVKYVEVGLEVYTF